MKESGAAVLGQSCPGDTCQAALSDFDKMQRAKFLPSPILHALKYFDNFYNVVLITTASRGLSTSERSTQPSIRGAGSGSIGGSEGDGEGGGESYIYIYT